MQRLVALLPLIALVSACGDQQRPAYASQDERRSSARDPDAAASLVQLPADSDDPCETIVELPIVKPNFYFVLDASGSMIERMPDTNASRYRAAVAAISDMLEGVRTRVNVGATVFPRTFAGASCQAGNEVFALVDGSGSVNGTSTVKALDNKLRGYVPEGGSPVSPTLHDLYPTLRSFEGATYVFLLSDGAPNCNLSRSCGADECILNLESATFGDGTMCDESLNCCAPDWFPHLCLDRDPTLDELTRLASANIATYIIGMPGGAPYASLLNEMAIAAGTARVPSVAAHDTTTESDAGQAPKGAGTNVDAGLGAIAPEPGGPPNEGLLYYQISDTKSLALALATLSREILVNCTLQLDFAPSKPEFLQVTAGDQVLTSEQWALTAETEIELLGDACADWKAGKLPQVRVQQTCRAPAR